MKIKKKMGERVGHLIRFPPDLWAKICESAEKNNRFANQEVVERIMRSFEQ